MNLFEHDADLKAWALEMWANRIETGHPDYSANDFADVFRKPCPMVLDDHKRQHIARLRRLAAAERAGGGARLAEVAA